MASVTGVIARGETGIRLVDVALTAVVAGAVELFVAAASGPGQHPLHAQAYLVGAALILVRTGVFVLKASPHHRLLTLAGEARQPGDERRWAAR